MTVERLGESFSSITSDHLLVKPDLGVGSSLRHKVFTDVDGKLVHLLVDGTQTWVGTAHDVSVDVTTRSDGVKGSTVDFLNSRLQVTFDDTVELESLTGSKLESVIAPCVRDVVDGAPLFRLANTGWHADSDHEGVGWLETLIFALFTNVTVVLLVNTYRAK